MAQLLARLSRSNNRAPAAVYLLKDMSGAIPGEEQLFQMLDTLGGIDKLTLGGQLPCEE